MIPMLLYTNFRLILTLNMWKGFSKKVTIYKLYRGQVLSLLCVKACVKVESRITQEYETI